MSVQRIQALAAIRRGAQTSSDLARELDIDRRHASVLLYNMAQEKTIRFTGKFVPPTRPGPGYRVYEAVGHETPKLFQTVTRVMPNGVWFVVTEP